MKLYMVDEKMNVVKRTFELSRKGVNYVVSFHGTSHIHIGSWYNCSLTAADSHIPRGCPLALSCTALYAVS